MAKDKDDEVLSPHCATTIAATATTGCHTVKIDGYSVAKLLGAHRQAIDSCRFRAAGQTWFIRCYLSLSNKDRQDAGYISLYLVLAEKGVDAAVGPTKFRFSLVAHPGGPAPTDTPWEDERWTTVTCPAVGDNSFPDYLGMCLNRSKLETSEYLKDDSFIVRCEIAGMDTPVVTGHCLQKLALPSCGCPNDNDDDNDSFCKRHHVFKGALGIKIKQAFLKFFLGCLPLREY